MSDAMPDPHDLPPRAEPPVVPSTASLIERAMQAFERGRFAPPPPAAMLTPKPAPMPGDVPPPGQVYHWQTPRAATAPVAPAAPIAMPAPRQDAPAVPVIAPGPDIAPAPDIAPPPLAANPAPRIAPAVPSPAAARPGVHRINRQTLAAHGILPPESGASAQIEEFRLVKRRLIEQAEDLFRRGGGPAARRIMVTSPGPGEGKTFSAISLALSMAAEKDSDVLLVDLDLARATVSTTLGLPASPGLMDAIADPTLDVRQLVMRTDVPGLSVLPGGRPTRSDAEYLASARAQAVLDMLSADAPSRIVLFDTPPVLAASLPVELAKLVGQGVMVVRANATSAGAINDAASLLAGCPNLQLLLNAVQFSPSGRRFGAYHGYRG